MLRQLAVLLLVALAATKTTEAQTTYAPVCLDPPSNSPIAAVVANAMESMRPVFYTGIPILNIPVLDPFGPLPPLSINVNTTALVLHAAIKDTMVRNLGQYIVCQVNITLGISPKFDFIMKIEDFRVDGLYNLTGLITSIIPVFGHGNFTIDALNAGFEGSGAVSYSLLHDRISIKHLALDVFFDELKLVFDNIMGGGAIGDALNNYISDVAASMFRSIWDHIGPILSSAVENAINNALYNVSVSDLLPPQAPPMSLGADLGNANFYMDMILRMTSRAIKRAGLEPASLPDTTLDLGNLIQADLVNGTLAGLSTIHRSGTATVDTVTDWIFLYANVAIGPLEAIYRGVVTDTDGTTDTFEALVSLNIIDIYVTARGDVFSYILDLDQFVITELGPLNVELRGLGLLGWLAGPITEGITNLFMDDLQVLLSTQVKEALQTALNENPWPGTKY